jgi:hypothetical protein
MVHRWFTLAVFAGAALLFTVEPLTGRLVLPLAGGTPAVWTTCLLFFQAALLAGYAYAHFIGDRLSIRAQIPLHFVIIALPAMALPIVVDQSWFAGTGHPVLTLLPMLAKTVGLPFFALATTAPLMQRWFANVAPSRDPYPLYAASNAGSLLALAAYPFVVEPALGLVDQGRWWAVGYGVYAIFIVGCAGLVWRAPVSPAPKKGTAKRGPWLRWIMLSFAPSSLLMGVTTAITTDITPVPLLWVVPLAIYLLTFILAFAGRPILSHQWVCRAAPVAALALFFALLTSYTRPWWAILSIHLLAFFLAALACHGELAKLKPPAEGLTHYYLLMSVGGVLGGVLNAIVAPIVFQKLGLAEYPLVMALAVALLPNRPRAKALEGIPEAKGVAALAYPVVVAAITAIVAYAARWRGWSGTEFTGLLFGAPLVFMYLLIDRPVRFGVGLALLWFAGLLYAGDGGTVIDFDRNFFGIVRVSDEVIHPTNGTTEEYHRLMHGSTLHGRQKWLAGHGINEPLSYYGRPGPIGDAFRVAEKKVAKAVAICGLGAGSLAAYARPGQVWTFYEIDPAMVRIARNQKLFTFLDDNFTQAAPKIALGDARLEMAQAADSEYDLIVLDAFSSDSIPVHLLTREAIELYCRKLAPRGMIVFHISNRYLDLKPVLAAAARDLNLSIRYRFDEVESKVADATGRTSSEWVALAREKSDLGSLVAAWDSISMPSDGFRTWTDDYSNLFGVFIFDRDWKTPP